MAPVDEITLDEIANPFKDCSLSSPISSDAELATLLTSQQIDMNIGSDREHIQAPQGILSLIPFFAKGCEGGFSESSSKAFDLPDESPIAVTAVIGWLFHGASLKDLQGSDEVAGKPLLASVLLLADKWCIDSLKMACCKLICHLLENCGKPIKLNNGKNYTHNLHLIGEFYDALSETRYRYISIYLAELHCFYAPLERWEELSISTKRRELWATTHNHAFWTELSIWRGIFALSSLPGFSEPRHSLCTFLFLLCKNGVHESTASEFSSLVNQGCENKFGERDVEDISAFIRSSLSL